jgi:hypothetical protein
LKKFNKLLITGVITAIFAVLVANIFIVYAAFRFSKTVEEGDSIIGGVEINSRSIVSYQQEYTTPSSQEGFNAEFFRKCKLRTDSVCNVEGLKVNKDANDNLKLSDARATAYNSKNAVVTTNTIANDTKLQLTSTTTGATFDMVLSFTFNAPANEAATIATATIDSGGSNYEVVVGMDGLSLFIFDKTAGKKTITNTIDLDSSESDKIEAYASVRNKYYQSVYDNGGYSMPYLGQIALQFEITPEIPVYVRIHIQDQWESERFTTDSESTKTIISKDKIDGKSPFAVADDNWYYDESKNIAYLKTVVIPEKYTAQETKPTGKNTGDFKSITNTFDVSKGYFYNDTSSQARSTITKVKVSFTIDVVQANRVEALWGIDPTTLS